MTTRKRELAGLRFGRLVVLNEVPALTPYRYRWACLCDCGTAKEVAGNHLMDGKIRSCGCLRVEDSGGRFRTHGRTGTTEHRIWNEIRRRCLDPLSIPFADYGGRGITICARWDSFENFLADMGPRPKGMTLDRRNNDGPYSPDNCHWATWVQQANNRRSNRWLEHDGKRMTVAQWAAHLGIKPQTISMRLNSCGWPVERALRPPKS